MPSCGVCVSVCVSVCLCVCHISYVGLRTVSVHACQHSGVGRRWFVSVMSCIIRPSHLVRHCHVLQCQVLGFWWSVFLRSCIFCFPPAAFEKNYKSHIREELNLSPIYIVPMRRKKVEHIFESSILIFFFEFFFKFQIWTYAAAGCSAVYLGP